MIMFVGSFIIPLKVFRSMCVQILLNLSSFLSIGYSMCKKAQRRVNEGCKFKTRCLPSARLFVIAGNLSPPPPLRARKRFSIVFLLRLEKCMNY